MEEEKGCGKEGTERLNTVEWNLKEVEGDRMERVRGQGMWRGEGGMVQKERQDGEKACGREREGEERLTWAWYG